MSIRKIATLAAREDLRRGLFGLYRGLLVLLLVLPGSATAVTPQFWENFTQADLLGGSLDRMSIASDGKLFISRSYDMVFDTQQPYIFSMVRDSKGNLYVGTGDEGKVFRIDPQGSGSVYFEAEEMHIFALALDSDDCLYVGSSPDGKVYKVTGPNQSEEYFDVDDKYIWAMVFDDKDNLYIGTGGGGIIYKVKPNGDDSVFYRCGDTHVRYLARNQDGKLFAGTSPSGLLIQIDDEGKGFTLMDSPMEEVHSIVFGSYGEIYAVASSVEGGGKKSESGSKSKTGIQPEESSITIVMGSVFGGQNTGGEVSAISAPGNGETPAGTTSAVYLVSKDGSVETLFNSRKGIVFGAALDRDGSLLLATGTKGRLLSIDSAKQVTVLTDTSEEHVTQLLSDGETVYAGTSNQGKVYKLLPTRANTGGYESKILDVGMVASWGKIFWQVNNSQGARFKFFTRTGNTEKIDNSWSEWSAEYTEPGRQIVSPDARYLQWRVSARQGAGSKEESLSDLLDGIQIAYLEKNLRPQVTKIDVLPPGIELQSQVSLTISSASLAVQTVTPDGRSLNAPREREKSQQDSIPRQVLQPGAQSFDWEASDSNGDSLEYSIYFKSESETDWKLLEEKYTDTYYTAYPAAIPDGTYRLKVVASDAPSNPYDKYLTGELVSQPFVIANTPPRVEIKESDVTGKKIAMEFEACLSAGNIATAEFSIDGSEWKLVFPTDGIADSKCEQYRFVTPELSVGEHLVGIRASGRDGNTGIARTTVRIP